MTADARIEILEGRLARAERRFRVTCGLALVVLVSAIMMDMRPVHADAGGLPALDQRVTALQTRVAAVEAKTAPINIVASDTFGTTEVVFSGVNVRIQNGLGSTETKNGLGNLIVGYNEHQAVDGIGPNTRT